MTAAEVKRAAAQVSDPQRAEAMQRFFRTGPGEYGEGDRFLGITVPQQRTVARTFRELPLPEVKKLLASPLHEHRLIALLILVQRHMQADAAGKAELNRFYLEQIDRVNNWIWWTHQRLHWWANISAKIRRCSTG